MIHYYYYYYYYYYHELFSPPPWSVSDKDLFLAGSPLTCNALAMEAEVSGISELVAVNTETVFSLKSSNNTQVSSEVTVLCKSFFKVTQTPATWRGTRTESCLFHWNPFLCGLCSSGETCLQLDCFSNVLFEGKNHVHIFVLHWIKWYHFFFNHCCICSNCCRLVQLNVVFILYRNMHFCCTLFRLLFGEVEKLSWFFFVVAFCKVLFEQRNCTSTSVFDVHC